MSSIPRLEGQAERLAQIPGSMPRLDEIPPGCAFRTRCPHAFAHCVVERPPMLPAGGTAAACWLYEEAVARTAVPA
jgi:peptide/nickel transport system ATP-binding protein